MQLPLWVKQSLHWIVLVVSLAVTASVTALAYLDGRNVATQYFDELVSRKIRELGEGIGVIEQNLFAAAGLFGMGEPTPGQWATFVAGLTQKGAPPSLVELGYAKANDSTDAEIRLVAPLGGQPFSNQGALLGARSEAADAMARVRLDGLPALSRRFAGMPGRAGIGQGALLLVPVREGTATTGYVFAAVRLDELAAQVSRADAGYFRLWVFEGRDTASASAIFAPTKLDGQAQFNRTTTTVLDGQVWTLVFESTPSLEALLETRRPYWIFAAGLAGSLLLFGLAWSLSQTRRRAAEIAERMTRELSDQAKFSDDLVELNPNPMFRKDLDGRYVSFNREWERLTGRNRADWIGKRNDELLPGDSASKYLAQDRDLLEHPDHVDRQEARIVATDGKVFDVIVSKAAVRRADGSVIGIIGTITDVTESKRLAEELAHQSELLELVNQSAQAGVWDRELPSGRSYFSPRYCEMLGYPADADLGPLVARAQLLHPDDRARVNAAREAHFKRETPYFHSEYRLQRADGSYLWVMGRGIAAFADDGTPQRFTGSIIDIAERKEAEFALIEANARATEAAQAKSAFLATMSHEIRTPLNGVLGSAGLLLDTPLTSDQHDFVDTIRLSGDQLLVVINDILDFSKIESGHMELEDLPLEVSGMIEDAFDLVGDRARRKNLETLFEIDPAVPPYVTGDITRLRQVLINLLGNSIKFTEAGEVRVLCTLAERNGDELVLQFEVRDTGIGIQADKIDRLFHAFSQVDASTTRKYGGTGLGLAICRRLVEMMGGTIRATSEFGKGACFTFTVRSREVERSLPLRQIREKGLLPHSLLLVDDYPPNLRILAAQCAKWGLTTTCVGSAMEALTLIEEARMAGNPFGAVITDMAMPEMDGLDLTAAIAAHNERHRTRVPVIILSSAPRAEAFDGRAVPPNWISAYLLKPARQSQIFNALQEALAPDRPFALGDPDEAGKTKQQANLALQTGELSILLAEDNEVNAKLASKMLERLGRTALHVADGLLAVEAALATQYDCVLMDIQMPGIDGLEATRRIRGGLDLLRQPYIIAMTANAMAGDREMCLNAGMDDYVSKPIQIRLLSEALGRAALFKARRDETYPSTASPALAVPASGAHGGAVTAGPVAAAAPSAQSATDVLDMEQVGELIALDATLGVLADFVGMYAEQSPPRLAALRAAFDAGDLEEVGRIAHSFKGASANLGAVRVAETARLLEHAGRLKDGSAMPGWLNELDARYAEARDALRALAKAGSQASE